MSRRGHRRRVRLVGSPLNAVLFVLSLAAFASVVLVAGAAAVVRSTWGADAAGTVTHIGLIATACLFGPPIMTAPWWTSDN